MWHLDTNIVIAYLNGNREIAEKIKAALPDLAVSSMVFGELLYGAKASRRHVENLERLREFMQFVEIVDFDQDCAEAYSDIRLDLRLKGRPTGEVDALIAATAMAYHATLVTDNVKHFAHIEGLMIENWLRAERTGGRTA